uniref:ABC transporter permease n=1 Tax=Thaumasiovibrio occultus TaxID=1891184 RepID=UPI000B3636AF|nr:ABC transporter permease [Thaumasiovibrio occultus]
MFAPVANALWGHYRKHKLQLILMWLGLTLGISLLVGVLAINYQARLSYGKNAQLFELPFNYRIVPQQPSGRIDDSFYISLRRAGFDQCVPIQRERFTHASGAQIEVLGVDAISLLNLSNDKGAADYGRAILSPPYPLFIASDYAEFLGVEDGANFETSIGTLGTVKLAERLHFGGSRIITDIGVLRNMKRTHGLTGISCQDLTDEEQSQILAALPPSLKLENHSHDHMAAMTNAFHSNLLAMGMLSFVVGMFIFFQAMSLSFTQRQPLVGQLRQLGVGGRQLTSVLVVEVLLWLVVAVISGNLLGLMLANQLMSGVAESLGDLYGAQVSDLVEWHWQWGGISVLAATGGTLLACGWPMVRLIKTPPARLSRQVSLHRFSGREFVWQALFAVVLAVIAGVIYAMPSSQATGFVVIALLLLAVALFTPYLIWGMFTSLSYRFADAKLRWFCSDAAVSLSYRGVASMAFMLAMAANIGMDTMVGSFRQATFNWLETRVASDIYMHPKPMQSSEMQRWLNRHPDVAEIRWQWRTDLNTELGMIQAYSIGTSASERASLAVKVSKPDYWFDVHLGKGILVSESLAHRHHWNVGDVVTLPVPLDKEWQIAGIYYDYGNPYGQVLLPHDSWREYFGNTGQMSIAVTLKPGSNIPAVMNEVQQAFGLSDEDIINQASLLAEAKDVFNSTFKVTDSLGMLTLFIAVTGLFFATTAGELSRAKQFSLLRCMGMTGKELVMLGGGQLLVIGLLNAVIALPLGLGLAHLLIDRVLLESFGWSMDLLLFPQQYMAVIGVSIVALLLAGGWPVVRLVRRSAIRSFREAI